MQTRLNIIVFIKSSTYLFLLSNQINRIQRKLLGRLASGLPPEQLVLIFRCDQSKEQQTDHLSGLCQELLIVAYGHSKHQMVHDSTSKRVNFRMVPRCHGVSVLSISIFVQRSVIASYWNRSSQVPVAFL